MSSKRLLELLGQVDDRYVAESDPTARPGRQSWMKWGALAACAAVVLLAGTVLGRLPNGPFNPPPVEESAPVGETPPVSESPSIIETPPVIATPPAVETPVVTAPPVLVDGLPLITAGYGYAEGGGGGGAWLYQPADQIISNPWTEDAQITTLPVYYNPLHTDSGNTADEAARRGELEEKLALWDGLGELEYDIPVYLDGTARIEFSSSLPIPEEFRFDYNDVTLEDATAIADYVMAEYGELLALLGVDDPVPDIEMYTYNIHGQLSCSISFYQRGESAEENLFNYHFRRIHISPSLTDNGIRSLSVYYHDLSQKQGDYPIITVEEARELLLDGHFYGKYYLEGPPGGREIFCPAEEDIIRVELIYGNNEFHQFFQPFYQFTAELPENCYDYYDNELGLKSYGTFSVPAVEGKYLAEMPFAGTFGNS